MAENYPSDTPFSEAGFSDIGMATEMFDTLKITSTTFSNPREFSKLKDIADFFKGTKDSEFIVESVIRRKANPSINPLDHVWSYVQLHKQKSDLEKKMGQISKELSFYE